MGVFNVEIGSASGEGHRENRQRGSNDTGDIGSSLVAVALRQQANGRNPRDDADLMGGGALNLDASSDGVSTVRDLALPDWADVAAAIDRNALACTPAELHGALCGWLAGGAVDAPDWLRQVMVDPALALPKNADALDRMHSTSLAQLDDPQFGFQLLLPEHAGVAARAEAVFAWCRGFLGGFGLVPDGRALSDEGQEALRDLGNLAAAQMDDEGDSEDEEALAEIEEYLRVAVLLLHADRSLAPPIDRRLH